jgi:hypothetical protein
MLRRSQLGAGVRARLATREEHEGLRDRAEAAA